MPRRLTAAQCSAAAVCAARIRSPYGRYLGQVSDCTCCPGSLACALFCCSSRATLAGWLGWLAGWLGLACPWPQDAVSPRCLSPFFLFRRLSGTSRNVSTQRVWRPWRASKQQLIGIHGHCYRHPPIAAATITSVAVISTVGPRPRRECQPTRGWLGWLIHFSPVSPSDCPASPALPARPPDGLVGGHTFINFAHYSAVWWLDPSAPSAPSAFYPRLPCPYRAFRHIPSAVCHLPHFPPPVSSHRPQTTDHRHPLSSYSRDLSNANVGWRPR